MTRETGNGPFPAEPEDTRTAIMKATFEALCEYGYADLTIQRIGERFPKSKSLLYHHYDGKDDLLLEFLEYMLERFEEREIAAETDIDPEMRLRRFIDRALPTAEHDHRDDFVRALVELRAQAAHDAAYCEQFSRTDQHLHEYLADIVADGVESGIFRDVDPDAVAAFLATVVTGTSDAYVTTTDDSTPLVRKEVTRYLDRCLLSEDC